MILFMVSSVDEGNVEGKAFSGNGTCVRKSGCVFDAVAAGAAIPSRACCSSPRPRGYPLAGYGSVEVDWVIKLPEKTKYLFHKVES